MSLDAKEAGDLFRFPASFVLVINIQNAFDLTQVGFWDCIYRVKSQDDFTSTVNLTALYVDAKQTKGNGCADQYG